ncbi:MAG: UDP-N-acetylmuramoyl-L-alanyl-D-glutamate--2,6-diaminopimelate ligase [Candidatus Omnitrophota bacterium]
MRIEELIKPLDITGDHLNLPGFQVRGVACNSKEVSSGFIFVAVKGSKEDGNRYIQEAISRGAKAIVIQVPGPKPKIPEGVSVIEVKDARKALAKLAAEFYGHPSAKIKVIGITGTNGKTTVSYLLEALLKKAGFSPAVIGTVNYRFKNRITPSKNTTPGPIELESMLAGMLKEGSTHTVMEVSSHALDQDRVEGINFHSAIFTNLTQDHLDYHKTLKSYFNAKARLFKNLNPDSFAVINSDDKHAGEIKKMTRAKVITYGIKNKAKVSAGDIKFDSLGTEFKLISPEGKIDITSRLVGIHNVYNILAACAWALREGIDIPFIRCAIAEFNFVPGRLERIDFAGNFLVFVDYAHTEDALKNTIKTVRRLTKNRVITVFGCGGERDRTKRPKMGKAVSELADYAIISNDNPRSEDPQEIIEDIKRGINGDNYCVIPDRREAIKKSLSLAKPGDIVLIAGKGHEECQIIKNKAVHFSDREVVRECLRSVNY